MNIGCHAEKKLRTWTEKVGGAQTKLSKQNFWLAMPLMISNETKKIVELLLLLRHFKCSE